MCRMSDMVGVLYVFGIHNALVDGSMHCVMCVLCVGYTVCDMVIAFCGLCMWCVLYLGCGLRCLLAMTYA